MIEFESLLVGLAEKRLPFVVVGGLAVGVNAAVRATRDVDILMPPDRDALASLYELLEEWGSTRPDETPLDQPLFDGSHGIRALTPRGQLDVMMEGDSPLTYREVAANAHRIELGGHAILFCGLAELVAMKRLAGRPIDRWDLERLQQAHGALPETDPPVNPAGG